jgi:hypothetical protein
VHVRDVVAAGQAHPTLVATLCEVLELLVVDYIMLSHAYVNWNVGCECEALGSDVIDMPWSGLRQCAPLAPYFHGSAE